MDPVVVEVFHHFRAQERHQLTINVGERIVVIEKDPTGWWIGRNASGQVGIFPSTYTRGVSSAPPPVEVTREMIATKIVQELGLGGSNAVSSSGGSGAGMTRASGAVSPQAALPPNTRGSGKPSANNGAFTIGSDLAAVPDVDIDDLFAMSDVELGDELANLQRERDRLKEVSASLLSTLVDTALQERKGGGDDLSDRLQSERQHLTIGKRTLAELNATEAQLAEDTADMVDLLTTKGIAIPQCLVDFEAQQQQRAADVAAGLGGSTSSSITSPKLPFSIPGSASSAAAMKAPKGEKKKGTGKKAKPAAAAATAAAPADEEWLAGVTEKRLVPYCRRLERELRKCNETLDKQEVSLEGLAKSVKLLEAQLKEKEAALAGNETELAKRGEVALKALDDQLAEANNSYAALKAEALDVQSQEERLQAQVNEAAAKCEEGRVRYLALMEAVEAGRAQVEKFKDLESDTAAADANFAAAAEMAATADALIAEAQQHAAKIQEQLAAEVAKYRQVERKRRETYNKIQELKGNLRVYCRIKPTSSGETNECVRVLDDMTLKIEDPETSRESVHEFDLIIGEKASQEEIFEEVRPLATSVLDGYNVCIFAYGQTGSGKTYTMEGPPGNRGVNYRAVRELFQIAAARGEDYKFVLSVSVLEIYNDKCFDLLGSRAQSKVRWGGPAIGVVVEPLAKQQVHSVDEVQAALEAAYVNRSVAGTDCNTHSSRSHCVLTVYVDAENPHNGTKVQGKLHLIDLAGSERVKKSGVEGDRLKEAAHINTSLSHLKTVIQGLVTKAEHVAYRNSTLTALLQDSLGGNCKCLMFANISAHTPNIPETICTLKYASEARKVEVGKVTANVQKKAGNGSNPVSPATPGP